MDVMHEIVTVEQVHRIFLVLAIALPVAGGLVGLLLGVLRKAPVAWAVRGVAVGLVGPANFGLWVLYNSITDRLGLDTVRNLLTNLGLFAAIGLVAGVGAGLVVRRKTHRA